MKKTFLLAGALVLSLGIFSFTNKISTDTLTVDTQKSKVTWNGAAPDHYHVGEINIKSGTVSVEDGKITGGTFTLDLNSIKSTDGTGEKLDGHLKSPDFFDAVKGDAVYTITGVKYTAENVAEITGTLSVKGLTVPVSLTGKIRGIKDGNLFAQANFSLDPSALAFKYVAGIDVSVSLFASK